VTWKQTCPRHIQSLQKSSHKARQAKELKSKESSPIELIGCLEGAISLNLPSFHKLSYEAPREANYSLETGWPVACLLPVTRDDNSHSIWRPGLSPFCREGGGSFGAAHFGLIRNIGLKSTEFGSSETTYSKSRTDSNFGTSFWKLRGDECLSELWNHQRDPYKHDASKVSCALKGSRSFSTLDLSFLSFLHLSLCGTEMAQSDGPCSPSMISLHFPLQHCTSGLILEHVKTDAIFQANLVVSY
jgi:hypothetical protein